MPKVKGTSLDSPSRNYNHRKVKRKPIRKLVKKKKKKKPVIPLSPKSDTSETSGEIKNACAPAVFPQNKMAAMFNREASFEDNRSDLYDDDDDRGFFQVNESDEDTEDASETDMAKLEEEFTEMKEQMYQEKLQDLKQQLSLLNQETIKNSLVANRESYLEKGKHSDYMKRISKLEKQRDERLLIASICRSYEIDLIENEYVKEKKAAQDEFDQKKVELKETLLSELQEKRKAIENERVSMELTGDSVEVKPAVTRKLRRRPNDPLPAPEKRRKTSPQINYLLDEEEILEDLRALNKIVITQSETSATAILSQNKSNNRIKGSGNSTGNNGSSDALSEPARIEDGKLFYDKRWYHRGNGVIVDSKENGKYSGILHSIGQSEVCIKKADNTKARINVSALNKGKISLKKKSLNSNTTNNV